MSADSVLNLVRNYCVYAKLYCEFYDFHLSLEKKSPKEILEHAYEYSDKQDIVRMARICNLPEKSAEVLMSLPTPLDDLYKKFEQMRTVRMESINVLVNNDDPCQTFGREEDGIEDEPTE